MGDPWRPSFRAGGVREQPQAARRRLHRPLLPAPRRQEGAHRGHGELTFSICFSLFAKLGMVDVNAKTKWSLEGNAMGKFDRGPKSDCSDS